MSSSFNLKRLKLIGDRYKIVAIGYIRQFQATVSRNVIIPALIQHAIILYYASTLNSTILKTKEEDRFLSLLKNVEKLKHLNGCYTWNKIYQASIDGYSLANFREKCHNHPNLMCFIHTDTDNVFGGYTSTGWHGDISKFGNMHDTKSFLFLIRSSSEYKPEIFDKLSQGYKGDFAVITRTHCVCMFGGGYDICIGKNCNITNVSYTAGWTYVLPTPSYLNGEKRKFCVIDIEVFQLAQ
eukprot:234190_1